MQPDAADILRDVKISIDYIVEDTSGLTLATFEQNRRARQLVERNFGIIGEALNRLSHHHPESAARISNLRQIVAFRNVLIHEYDIVRTPTVWSIIQDYLPTLRAEVAELLSDLER